MLLNNLIIYELGIYILAEFSTSIILITSLKKWIIIFSNQGQTHTLTTCNTAAKEITTSTCRQWIRQVCLVVTRSSRRPQLRITKLRCRVLSSREATVTTPNSSNNKFSMVLVTRSTLAWSIRQLIICQAKLDCQDKDHTRSVCKRRQAS